MRNPKHSYAYRGERQRRMDRIRKSLWVSALVLAIALLPREQPRDAKASSSPADAFTFGLTSEARHLRSALDATRGELALAKAQLERDQAVMRYSARYKIGADIAGSIYDVALAEGIEPELAFRLVRVESEFNEHATSPAGAIGLAQVMPATAREFDHTITREQLYDRTRNLEIGFRYLRALIDQYRGDLRTALLVYNRGPVAVETLRSLGVDPRNGYDDAVMKGYTGKGTVD